MGPVGSIGFDKSILYRVSASILLFHLRRLNVEKSARHLGVKASAVDFL